MKKKRRKRTPKATHGSPDRPLRIGDIEIPCYVLNDGRRVIVSGAIATAIGIQRGDKGGKYVLARMVESKAIFPFATQQLITALESPFNFRLPHGGMMAKGYEATILADLCDAVLDAQQAGKLHARQEHIAAQCLAIVRSFTRLGIIALIDEATGFQHDRRMRGLEKMLSLFIAKELMPWTKRFPIEVFDEIYRLKGWDRRKNYRSCGHLVNSTFYKRFHSVVLDKLRELNPPMESKGGTEYRKHKHHQFLSDDFGVPQLGAMIQSFLSVSAGYRTWDGFFRHWCQAFPLPGTQLSLLEEGES